MTVLDLPTAYRHRLVEQGVAWPPDLRVVIIGGEQASGAAVTSVRRAGTLGEHLRHRPKRR